MSSLYVMTQPTCRGVRITTSHKPFPEVPECVDLPLECEVIGHLIAAVSRDTDKLAAKLALSLAIEAVKTAAQIMKGVAA
jgi:hypothetical protein